MPYIAPAFAHEATANAVEALLTVMPPGLDKFFFSIDDENQSNVNLRTSLGLRPLRKIKFSSNINILDSKITYEYKLKIIYDPDSIPESQPISPNERVINIYENPEWWLSTTQGNSHYIFKILPPSKIKPEKINGEIINSSEIQSDKILRIIKLDFMVLPKNSILFS